MEKKGSNRTGTGKAKVLRGPYRLLPHPASILANQPTYKATIYVEDAVATLSLIEKSPALRLVLIEVLLKRIDVLDGREVMTHITPDEINEKDSLYQIWSRLKIP